MTETWHRTSALAGLPGMPKSDRPIRNHGARRGWICRTVKWGQRSNVLEWLETSLPAETQDALRAARGETSGAPEASGVTPSLVPDCCSADRMDARAAVVRAFESFHADLGGPLVAAFRAFADAWASGAVPAQDEVREAVPTFHWSTLQRWRNALLAGGHRALLSGRGGRRPTISEAQAETIAAMVFARPHHVTANQIIEGLTVRHPNETVPSISAVRRHVRRFRIENRLALDAVADPDGHRSRNRPAFGEAGADVSALNQVWELDSSPADLLCSDGKRYTIIGAIDVWSRRAKFLVAPSSCAMAVAALLRRCLLDWGVPETVVTDEGSDYTSKHIRRVLVDDLKLEHVILPPYSPELKPFIERALKTLNHDLVSRLPGFTGHSVADRKRIEAQRSFAARRGKTDVELFEVSVSPEELQHRLDQWSDALYAHRVHSGIGETPFARAASWTGEIRTVDERGLDILLAPPAGGGSRVVNAKEGIKVDGGSYIAGELGRWVKHRVQVRQDPADWGRIFAFAESDTAFPDGTEVRAGTFICVAEDPLRTGVDRAEVAAKAKALARKADQAARKWARDLKRTHAPSAIAAEVLDHAAAAAGAVAIFPKPEAAHENEDIAAAAAAAVRADAPEREPANADLISFYKRKGLI